MDLIFLSVLQNEYDFQIDHYYKYKKIFAYNLITKYTKLNSFIM